MAYASDVKGDGPGLHLYFLFLEPLREELNKDWDGVGGGRVRGFTQVLQGPTLPASLPALLSTWMLSLMHSCAYTFCSPQFKVSVSEALPTIITSSTLP